MMDTVSKLLLFASLLSCTIVPTRAALQPVGNVVATTVSINGADFKLDSGAVARVEVLADDIVRVRVNPSGQISTRISEALSFNGLVAPLTTVWDQPQATYLQTAAAIVVVLKTPFQLVVLRSDQSLVTADLPNGVQWDPDTGIILVRRYAPPDEHYFGLGERGGPLDRRGRLFTMFNVDWAAYNEFTDPLYISIPFFYGMRGGQAYGVFLNNASEPFFQMDPLQTGVATYGAANGELDSFVFVGPQPQQVGNAYARITGLAPLPPKWTLGYHQSRYGYSTQDQILQVAGALRQLNIPCDAIYLDIDYMNDRQSFTWNPVTFPSPAQMNDVLTQLGFHQVNIVEPLLGVTDQSWSVAAGSGLLLTTPSKAPLIASLWYGYIGLVDFTKDTARQWFLNNLKAFLATGISGTWNDLDEPAATFIPEAIYDYNGFPRSDLQSRNLYALNFTSLSQQAMRELRPNQRSWSLSRSGFSGIQRYAANWSGDTNSTWDSLRVSVQLTSHMGLSGQNQFGHDIGGFLGSPSPELFVRWLEFAAYTPFFRNHSMNTSAAREPWVFGEPYTTIIRETINERYRMLPYLYSLFQHASTNAEPVVAPLPFYFPQDTATYAGDQEFMLGPSLLVAPVSAEGAGSQSVYLPKGVNWMDLYTEQVYIGGQTIVAAAPLQYIPVYVREGAVLPFGPVMQYVSDPTSSPQLQLNFYPGADSAFALYEDDGVTMAYTTGNYRITHISRQTTASGANLSITRGGGSWNPTGPRYFDVEVHGQYSAPSRVLVNGIALLPAASQPILSASDWGWFYNASSHRLMIKLQDVSPGLSVSIQH
jgi:alpha-glucosidase